MSSTCRISPTTRTLCLDLLACAAVWLTTLGPACAQGPPAVVRERLLVRFRTGISAARAHAVIRAARASVEGTIQGIDVVVLRLPPRASEVAYARAFARRAEVQFAEPDWVCLPALLPNDPSVGSQWYLSRIGCPQAWDNTLGAGVTIAILDSGVDATHPDLAPKLVPGYNAYDDNADTSDLTGHGTAVAGCAAAATDNGEGVAGVGWACPIMPIRICTPEGYSYASLIASGLVWAADHGARVGNISYGVSSTSSTLTAAAQYFMSKGGVVALCAGNESTCYSIPDNPYILTVSATDSDDLFASFSNSGTQIDLAAPGVSMKTTSIGGGYGYGTGTSFSAPVVAGVAGLVLSANPALSADQVCEVLCQSALDLGVPGRDIAYGWGRVDAASAVALAMQTNSGPAPDTAPPSVVFVAPVNGSTVSGVVSVQVSASDNVGVKCVTLFLDGAEVASATSQPYTFSWDTYGGADGVHTLRAAAEDAAGNTATTQIATTVNNAAADSTPPSVSFANPVNGSTVSGIVLVQMSAKDNEGVTSVKLYIDGAQVWSATAPPHAFSWDTWSYTNGVHTLQAAVADPAGNTATAQISVTVNNVVADTTPPTVSITSPTTGTKVRKTVSVKVKATDNVGVTKVGLYVDGKLTATSTRSPFTTSWNPRKAASGAHQLVCIAYDAAENAGASQTVTVYK